MQASELRIDSRQAAELFGNRIERYCTNNEIFHGHILDLADAFDELAKPKHNPRSFPAYLDLYLQDIALQKDVTTIANEVNREYKTKAIDDFFDQRMNLYIASSNAVHRIRAMWDKLMGLTVLLNWPDKYDEFCKSKSRLKYYRRIASSWPASSSEDLSDEDLENVSQWRREVEAIEECVRFISDNYRTSEAHFIGRLSKWAFTIQEDLDDPFIELIESSNAVRDHLRNVSNLILFIRAWG